MAGQVTAIQEDQAIDKAKIARIIESQDRERGGLISILEDIQIHYGYLPEEALRMVAENTGRDMVDIYGVATFYKFFSLNPRGKHLISCCLGTACHVRGAPKVAEELQHHLGIKPGETTPDKRFTLETVNCLGACALGPVVVVDGHYFPSVNASKVKGILAKAEQEQDKTDILSDPRIFPVDVACSKCNHSLMDPTRLLDYRPTIRLTLAYRGEMGALRMSSLYGSRQTVTEVEVPLEEIADLHCPHCLASLEGSTKCPECGVLMASMVVRQGGMIHVCPRRACPGHLLNLD
jgi:NADH-quinone oxidoreductase subunit E